MRKTKENNNNNNLLGKGKGIKITTKKAVWAPVTDVENAVPEIISFFPSAAG